MFKECLILSYSLLCFENCNVSGFFRDKKRYKGESFWGGEAWLVWVFVQRKWSCSARLLPAGTLLCWCPSQHPLHPTFPCLVLGICLFTFSANYWALEIYRTWKADHHCNKIPRFTAFLSARNDLWLVKNAPPSLYRRHLKPTPRRGYGQSLSHPGCGASLSQAWTLGASRERTECSGHARPSSPAGRPHHQPWLLKHSFLYNVKEKNTYYSNVNTNLITSSNY